MKNILLLCLVFSLTLILSSSLQSSSATELSTARCATKKFDDAFKDAGAVFVGKVLSKKSEGSIKVFELEVEKYWKGIDEKNIVVNVNENPRYQAQFEIGKSYLVFAEADEDSGKLFDRRCSRTKPIDEEFGDLQEDLEKLGKAKTCDGLSKK